MSAGVLISWSRKNASMLFEPRPLISKAFFETKCFNLSIACAGQTIPPIQRLTTTPCSRIAALPQSGQFSGKTNIPEHASLLLISTEIICGITSPALCTTT